MDFNKNSEQAELFLDQEPASEPIYWRTPDLDGAVRTDGQTEEGLEEL